MSVGGKPADVTSSPVPTTVTRHNVFLNRTDDKTYNILKFSSGPVDFSQWTNVTAMRDLTVKRAYESKSTEPEFGAGSEFGRKMKDEAWRRKMGIAPDKNISVKDLPIKFRVNKNKQYVGKKEGGVNDNSSYFIMAHMPDNEGGTGNFQLLPVSSWFSASVSANYKTLDETEAEAEFTRRDKILNHFNLMLQKRLKDQNDEEDGESPAGQSGSGNLLADSIAAGEPRSKVYYKNQLKSAASGLKISDYDEDYMSSSDDENKKNEEETKEKRLGGKSKKADDARESEEENEEESDDGDEEGLEKDYESESSESSEEEEKKDTQKADDQETNPTAINEVVPEEDTSDEDDEEDPEKDASAEKAGGEEEDESSASAGKGKKKGKSGGGAGSSSEEEDSSDEDDPDKMTSVLFLNKHESSSSAAAEPGAGAGLSTKEAKTAALLSNIKDDSKASKRKAASISVEDGTAAAVKKPKTEGDPSAASASASASADSFEELVRKYVRRKPTTTGELLMKLKKKRPDLHKDQICKVLVSIMKRLGLVSNKVGDKTFWSFKK